MTLDTTTLFFTFALMQLLPGIILLIMRLDNKKKIYGISCWSIASFVLAASLMIFVFEDKLTTYFMNIILYPGIISSFVLVKIGLKKFHNVKSLFYKDYAVIIISFIFYCLNPFFSLNIRIGFISLIIIKEVIEIIIILTKKISKNLRFVYIVNIILYLVVGITSLYRLITMIFQQEVQIYSQMDFISSTFFIIRLVAMSLVNYNLVLIVEKFNLQKINKAEKRLKLLEGIIPICSYCKNIRDDKGYWQEVEKYIAKLPTSQFTHGICPQCEKKLTKKYDF